MCHYTFTVQMLLRLMYQHKCISSNDSRTFTSTIKFPGSDVTYIITVYSFENEDGYNVWVASSDNKTILDNSLSTSISKWIWSKSEEMQGFLESVCLNAEVINFEV